MTRKPVPMDGILCDYCDTNAGYITRDSGEALCESCLTDQYSDPRDAAAVLTPATLRRYGRQEPATLPEPVRVADPETGRPIGLWR